MKKSSLILGGAIAAIVLLSMFAPAPFIKTVQADESAACKGLTNAYQKCSTNNGANNCSAIFEQLIAHNCRVSSSGSR
jgi:hypothetical protein